MKWFYDLRIRMKLIVSFVVMALIALTIGLLSIGGMHSLNENDTQLYEKCTLSIAHLGKITTAFHRMRADVHWLITAPNQTVMESYAKKIAARNKEVLENINLYKSTFVSKHDEEALNTLSDLYQGFYANMQKLIDNVRRNNNKEAELLLSGTMDKARYNVQAQIEKMTKDNEDEAKNKSNANTALYNSTKTIMLIISFIAVIIALGLGFFISKIISRPIEQVSDRLKELSDNDLTSLTNGASSFASGKLDIKIESTSEKLDIQTKDETGVLAQTLNSMIEKIKASINSVDSVTKTVVKVSDEINLLVKSATDGNLSTRGNPDKFGGGFKNIIIGLNNTLDAIIKPLNTAAEYVDRISKGDIPNRIVDNYNGDFNEIKNNLNTCIDAVNELITDANMLSKAAIEGRLSTRADVTKHNGDFRKIVEGVNYTLDSVIGPLNVAADYMNKISNGILPDKINDDYKGDFNDIKKSINNLIESTNLILKGISRVSNSVKDGNLSDRGNADLFVGAWKTLLVEINEIVDTLVTNIRFMGDNINNISNGNIPARIEETLKGDYELIKNDMNVCFDSIKTLIADMNLLSISAIEGKLSHRADAAKHRGDFRKIVEGVNNTLDAVIGPLNMAAEYVDKIAKGEIPEKITQNYNGDFNEIKSNLNTCIGSINALIDDSMFLSKAAIDGKLSARANALKHHGDFRKIIEGVNATLDSVIGPLNVAVEYFDKISKGNIPDKITDNYNGDFNNIKNSLNTCIDAIGLLINDTQLLAKSAVEGRLSNRADKSKHNGDFRVIVEGINQTLDSVIMPVNEGAAALEKMGKGDFTVRITSDYKGDHQIIKNSINSVCEALSKALGNVSEAVEATASASNEISASTEEMASGSQEQTQQTTEVAGAVEEMTRTILENTKNVTLAAEKAKDAGKKAVDGGHVVNETIEGMNKIADVVKISVDIVHVLGKSSDQIGEIVQVIDDIADQTNLLALNAAIEAARAGEQGRGFAVVADEVRKLAERTTKATKEIATMIRQIQKDTVEAVHSMESGNNEVEHGIALANKAGIALKEIVEGSGVVLDIISQVAAASEEQSTAAEEISRSIETISNVTHESTTGIQQIAQAAEDLNRLTHNLEELIGQFVISDTPGQFDPHGSKLKHLK